MRTFSDNIIVVVRLESLVHSARNALFTFPFNPWSCAFDVCVPFLNPDHNIIASKVRCKTPFFPVFEALEFFVAVFLIPLIIKLEFLWLYVISHP